MAGYLLDTHTAVWFFDGNDALSEIANRTIRDLSNPIFLSIASAWELAIKIGIGKLDFDGKTAGFLRLAETNDIAILPVKTTHLTTLESLPLIHRDPFDRILIATAIAERITLITNDENIAKYNVLQVW